MGHKGEILGFRNQGAEMLGAEAVREIFTLRRLGWRTLHVPHTPHSGRSSAGN